LLTLRKRLCNGRIFSSVEASLSSAQLASVTRCKFKERREAASPQYSHIHF
jgi:hypothetical protein